MSETENALLKTEIARLNKIIEALLSYNEALRQQIAVSEKVKGSEELFGSITEKDNGSKEAFGSITEKGKGSEELFESIIEKNNGSEEAFGSITEKGKGSEEAFASITEKNKSSEELFTSISEQNKPSEELFPSISEKNKPSEELFGSISEKLREKIAGKVKRSATQSSAKILLHIYNGGKGGYAALVKLTGLSEGGVGKRIMVMKKQGLITSDGHRYYKLTARGLGLLKEVAG